ncbi:MAG: glycosyltransferase [Balneolaceae bacterium]|nr:glycosyltransferase [Balneolaceae bacterium]
MINRHQPLVSAYIPTRNRADLVMRAVESVLKQTWQNLELIIVDDASDDRTESLLADIKSEVPVKIVRNSKPLGAAASRNIALNHANGPFVAGLDDDDLWMPERIELLMSAFKDGYSAVCSYDIMDYGERKLTWKKKNLITFDDLLYYNQAGNQVLTKKEYILTIGGYDEDLPSAQDYDLWIRLAQKFGPIKTVKKALQSVTMNENRESISTSGNKSAGYKTCFEKHKEKMNKKQIAYQEYRLKLAEGETAGWLELFRSTPLQLYKKEITRKLLL